MLPIRPIKFAHVVYQTRRFEEMERESRVRACYQHCVLKWIMRQRMTNQSLRERFKLADEKAVTISQVIGMAVEARLIKADDEAGPSRRLARYVPFWA